MEYKTEFGSKKQETFGDLNPGELFRFPESNEPMVRGGSDVRATSLRTGCPRGCYFCWEVIRIRIDRVEDSLPVFVDA